MQRKTHIIATIGPASNNIETLTRMAEAGMTIARLNFSHGDFDSHQDIVDNVREVSKKTGIKIGIMQDLSGPEIRTGTLVEDRIAIEKGSTVTFVCEERPCTSELITLDYERFANEVKVGEKVLVDDGAMIFEIKEIDGDRVVTEVLAGGVLKPHRGVNLPDSSITLEALTEKDKKDLEFGIRNNLDYCAFSFVRTGEDVDDLRERLKHANWGARIIPKIETQDALDNIDAIIEKSDGLMVARGDLAAEIGFQKVPLVQKELIRKCNEQDKFVIAATQMLETMIEKPRPTRAEVSDIANAILDGADAIMLSAESAAGKYPVESIEIMATVADEIEEAGLN